MAHLSGPVRVEKLATVLEFIIMNIRTRFAPSPTGYLHVGGLRTALFSYLYARKHGGQFLLRIEDTDQGRFVEDAVVNLLTSLKWAGIVPDEGVMLNEEGCVTQKGEKGPYIQSERLTLYQSYIQELIERGHAYYCFCNKERLEELRKIQETNKLPTGYDGHCRTLSADDVAAKKAEGLPSVVRMKMPKEGTTVFDDMVRGRVEFQNHLVDDQVLIKSDGFPTYHFAVVVDDHLMEITHVIRGEEWISSTPKHIILYQMFGWEAPRFAHLSLLVNEQKQKLSKRHGDVAVLDFAKNGFLPEALLNFVAFLGWNPGDEREIFTLAQLEQEFSIEKISKAAAVFNREKLDWYNQQHMKLLDNTELLHRALPYLLTSGLVKEAELTPDYTTWLEKAVGLEKERLITLKEAPEHLSFLLVPTVAYEKELLVWKKSTPEDAREKLLEIKEKLGQISDASWNKSAIEEIIIAWIKEKGYGVGDVLWPTRVALSGQRNSPGPFDIMDVLGKEKTMERLEKAADLLP